MFKGRKLNHTGTIMLTSAWEQSGEEWNMGSTYTRKVYATLVWNYLPGRPAEIK